METFLVIFHSVETFNLDCIYTCTYSVYYTCTFLLRLSTILWSTKYVVVTPIPLGCVHRKFENKIYMDFLFSLLLCPYEYLCKCHFLTLLNDPMHVFVFCCCLTSCCRELVVQTLSLWSWQCFTNIKLHKSSRKVSFQHFQIVIIVMVDVHISTSANFCNHYKTDIFEIYRNFQWSIILVLDIERVTYTNV